jgi:hypothetical protein
MSSSKLFSSLLVWLLLLPLFFSFEFAAFARVLSSFFCDASSSRDDCFTFLPRICSAPSLLSPVMLVCGYFPFLALSGLLGYLLSYKQKTVNDKYGKSAVRGFRDVSKLYFFVFLNTIPETLHACRIWSDERNNANATVSRPNVGCLPILLPNFDAILSPVGDASHNLHLLTGVYQRNVSLRSDTHLQFVD